MVRLADRRSALQRRAQIVQANKKRFTTVISEHRHEGASSESVFFSKQLQPLDGTRRPYPAGSKIQIEVVNEDSLVAARKLMDSVGDDAKGKTAVLNLASDQHPGGGYESGSMAQVSEVKRRSFEVFNLHLSDFTLQEEALCYSSTLFPTLLHSASHYPWPNTGPKSIAGLYSPGVVIFREALTELVLSSDGKLCPELPSKRRRVISVISVAAPRLPPLSTDGSDFEREEDRDNVREKVRLILRIAAGKNQRYLVLGALGCGAYRCPPEAVARLMKEVILEPEFNGWFRRIVFAVYSPPGNFQTFSRNTHRSS
ncbi:hypothetical protein GYMLUDRAFT_74893 [Collybiopsis luxurians FD-317 M1]|uniref:Microbial-type PARG catalytic domain-containing protein n=1 Tax=Collybiopsis luxurians FD-317 M1 TaxID=944289 RepID=A0A0D0BTD0_9AGAR|nr:hypothetical protein GYMLUDRAFT_74893 [Collybiopsis luxurians FD-317 M1]